MTTDSLQIRLQIYYVCTRVTKMVLLYQNAQESAYSI